MTFAAWCAFFSGFQAFHLVCCIINAGQFVWPDNVPAVVATVTNLFCVLAQDSRGEEEVSL